MEEGFNAQNSGSGLIRADANVLSFEAVFGCSAIFPFPFIF